MSMELQRDVLGITGHLSGPLTIYEVSDLHHQFKESCQDGDSVRLDLAGITELDTAGLQLLMALRQHLGSRLVLLQHSKPVIDMLDLYQLVPFFGDVIVLSDH